MAHAALLLPRRHEGPAVPAEGPPGHHQPHACGELLPTSPLYNPQLSHQSHKFSTILTTPSRPQNYYIKIMSIFLAD